MQKRFPERGRSSDAVMADLKRFKSGDCDFQRGRAPLFFFKATDEVYDLGKAAFFEYFAENALGGKRAFPSVKRMEEEVIAMALDLFNAPQGAEGFMTTGGTESIIQAVQSCRDWTRKERKDPGFRGNIVAPRSAHPAFEKGAKLMDIEVRRAPVGVDFRADVDAMAELIDDQTMMIIGSAPCFPYGVIDPIEDIAALARKHGLWMHVDACVGGYIAPFVRMIGREVPNFDLGVAGVCSMSADLHKFGFCPKPASTVFYNTPDKAACHYFDFDGWPNGRFLTNTIVGTRPAGGVAAAWAVFNYLGIEGYKKIAHDVMTFIDAYKSGVESIDGLRVIGKPHLSIVAFGSDDVDVFRVAEVMSEKGWLPGLVQQPKAIHRMMSLVHAAVNDEYLSDLRAAVGVVRQSRGTGSEIRATY